MKSIRLSLVIYFLVLLGLALGAVAWMVYHTVAQTLRDKELSTTRLIHAQFQKEYEDACEELDNRLRRQAHVLAKGAKSRFRFAEGLNALGAMTAPLHPQGYLTLPWYVAEGYHYPLAIRLYRLRTSDITIDSAEAFMPDPDLGDAPEYFQTFHSRGQPVQKSKSLGDLALGVTPEMMEMEEEELLQGLFDNLELQPGLKLRRYTLRVTVPSIGVSSPLTPVYAFFSPPRRPGSKTKSGQAQDVKPPPRPAMIDNPVPHFFIQYAIDTTAFNAALDNFASQRDARLRQVAHETTQALADVRQRLLWVGLATFVSLVAGGLFLVWLGLKPLARLSEAVSQVSAKDFRLKIDENKLPAELKPIAARLGETLEQLQQAFAREKQAAADISHELRTPVAALLATLDVALRKKRTAEEYVELLQDCRMSGENMAALVERLLALARLDAGADQLRPRRIDLADLVHQCADLVRPLAEAKGIALRVNVPSGLVFDADPDKWREILTNLLHNAVEYNRPHGAIDLSLTKKSGRLMLEVRDTGVGIDPEARPHIFKRFFRADPSRHADTPHSGLGLAIVKSYVDLMKGTIVVDSSPAGSTFRIETPAA